MDVPIYKPVNIFRALPQLIMIILLSVLFYFTIFVSDIFSAALLSIFIVLAYRYLIRYTVLMNSVKGIKCLKKGDLEGAIRYFDKYNAFFTEHEILNKYGFIIFLSPSKYTYKELALVNLAYSYAQKGDIDQAKVYYQECLKINPQNGMAVSSMNFIKANEK